MKTKNLLPFFSIVVLCLFSTSVFGQWAPKGNVGGGKTRGAFSFVIGTKAYLGGGDRGGNIGSSSFWEWDQSTNVWTQKAAAKFGWLASGFSIGNKGYLAAGDIGCIAFTSQPCGLGTNTLNEYDPALNTWTPKSNIGGSALREQAVAFSIGNYGYITTGTDKYMCPANGNNSQKDLWQWDQSTDTWTQMANLPGNSRYGSTGFTIGTNGYITTGRDENSFFYSDLWEWNQTTNTWTAKANFPGTARSHAASFAIGTKGYIGTGVDKVGNNLNDFWMWDQATDTWTQKLNFGGKARFMAVGFAIGSKGYIGTGDSGPVCNDPQKVEENDFWEFSDCGFTGTIFADPSTTVCVGQQVYLNASGGLVYVWNTGETTSLVIQHPTVTTTYSVTVTDASGCSGIVTLTVPVDTTCFSTSISNLQHNSHQVSVSPNPFSEMANIIVTGAGVAEVSQIKIYDIAGKEVRSASFIGKQYAIERKDLENGAYFYKIISQNNLTYSGKFVISRQ